MIAGSAARLVGIGFAQQDLLRMDGFSIAIARNISTFYANGMQLGDVICLGKQERHLSEWLAEIVHIQSGYDDSNPLAGQLVADLGKLVIKELGFIDADHVHACCHQQDGLGVVDRGGRDGFFVVGDNILEIVAGIDSRFEDFNAKVGNFCPFESPDQFFGFAGKHRSADHFDPPPAFAIQIWFDKHIIREVPDRRFSFVFVITL